MTQYLPSDLNFAYGSPVYGQNYLHVLGCLPSTDSSEIYTSGGILHAGYNQLAAKTTAAVYEDALSGTGAYGFMFRQVHQAAIVVTAYFRMLPASGAPVYQDLTEWAVMARIRNGTIADNGTTSVRYEDVDCYQFRMYPAAGGSYVNLELRKFIGGVASALGGIGSIIPVYGNPLNAFLGYPIGLSIQCTNVSGGVSITTRVVAFNPFTGAVLAPFVIHNAVEDTDSDSIQFSGRSGFVMGKPRDWVQGNGTDICESVKIEDPADGDVFLNDEWFRASLTSTDLTGVDFLGVQGYPVMGRFHRDQFSYTGTGGGVLMARDTSAARVEVDLGAGGANNYAAALIDHRPPTDQSRSHRAVDLELEDGAHDSIGAGLICFSNQVTGTTSLTGITAFTNLRCYAAVLEHTTSGDLRKVQVWRIQLASGGGVKKLAEYSEAGSGSLWDVGEIHDLDFDVYPTDNQGGFPNASVEMVVKLDGTQVVLTKASGAPTGVTVNAAGTVTDADDDKIVTGGAEGFIVFGVTKNDRAFFDNFTEETLHTPGTTPNEDHASIAVEDEAPNPSGIINDVIKPAWTIHKPTTTFAQVVPYANGTSARIAGQTNEADGSHKRRRRWSFAKATLTLAEHTALVSFFNDHNGIEQSFYYIEPDDASETQIQVVFESPILTTAKPAVGTYACQFQLVEVFS